MVTLLRSVGLCGRRWRWLTHVWALSMCRDPTYVQQERQEDEVVTGEIEEQKTQAEEVVRRRGKSR